MLHKFEGNTYAQSPTSSICQKVVTRLAQWVPASGGMTVTVVDGVPIGQSQHPWFALWPCLNL